MKLEDLVSEIANVPIEVQPLLITPPNEEGKAQYRCLVTVINANEPVLEQALLDCLVDQQGNVAVELNDGISRQELGTYEVQGIVRNGIFIDRFALEYTTESPPHPQMTPVSINGYGIKKCIRERKQEHPRKAGSTMQRMNWSYQNREGGITKVISRISVVKNPNNNYIQGQEEIARAMDLKMHQLGAKMKKLVAQGIIGVRYKPTGTYTSEDLLLPKTYLEEGMNEDRRMENLRK